MTRILMRAPHSPFVASNHDRALAKDEINTNAGNLLFPYSISRALMTPGTTLDFVKSCPRVRRDGSIPSYVNEKYDCFVIPLANAFRPLSSTMLICGISIPPAMQRFSTML